MKVIFFGDVFGRPGRYLIKNYLADLISETAANFVIANGENLAQGRGVTEKTANELFAAGIDAFTSGNHLWDQKNSLEFINQENRIVRPLNVPVQSIGNEYLILEKDNLKIGIICVLGQAFMPPAGFPIEAIERILPDLQAQTSNILIDIHAEATAEKRAIAHYLDGRLSAVIGSHTHIQTADEEILPQGTAYITDVGMTGPHDSVIGMDKNIIIQKMLAGIPQRFEVAKEGLQINAVLIDIDESSGKATSIDRIKRKLI